MKPGSQSGTYISYTTEREIKTRPRPTSLCDALIHGRTGHREKSKMECAGTCRNGREQEKLEESGRNIFSKFPFQRCRQGIVSKNMEDYHEHYKVHQVC